MTANTTTDRDERDTKLDNGEETQEIKVSGEGNGLVDDETSGGAAILQPDTPPADRKTANEINGKEGDEDAASQ
ncbi:hypothetical protein [Cupriavidus plantarum]|uniref:hypothetical protein n=1 Tax=Cupriavidus plantarum TaxID=942865 RepID=UPI000E392DC1|nr:hypothetical protein [Cupriavidus plantarum]NYI00596.1 hypothetical protein [Cupriavidus plantarum]REE93450.1 hypothetical protein C7418_2216 [Cupriavidus plantarum]RLK38878.1 hypothetical protein C7417_2404 [Cupriavidus plantarum]CAG2136751.1 hypothetical protein LMG26296_02412 [Cupriavidus plantarum]SMR84791.1 hypothetical protein SAMN05421735_3583 [Cupriavidus plantarum]